MKPTQSHNERTFSDYSEQTRTVCHSRQTSIPGSSKGGSSSNIEAPTAEEVKAAIKEMKNRKTAGVDVVTAETLMSDEHGLPY